MLEDLARLEWKDRLSYPSLYLKLAGLKRKLESGKRKYCKGPPREDNVLSLYMGAVPDAVREFLQDYDKLKFFSLQSEKLEDVLSQVQNLASPASSTGQHSAESQQYSAGSSEEGYPGRLMHGIDEEVGSFIQASSSRQENYLSLLRFSYAQMKAVLEFSEAVLCRYLTQDYPDCSMCFEMPLAGLIKRNSEMLQARPEMDASLSRLRKNTVERLYFRMQA